MPIWICKEAKRSRILDEDDIEGGPLVKAKHFEAVIIRMTISTTVFLLFPFLSSTGSRIQVGVERQQIGRLIRMIRSFLSKSRHYYRTTTIKMTVTSC